MILSILKWRSTSASKASGRGWSTSGLVGMLTIGLVLGACGKEEVEPVASVRAVKTVVISDMASAQVRKFPGTIEAVDSSTISFEVDGIIQSISIDVGDKFRKGDVLAVLDKMPFELAVESAKATLSRAVAQLEEKKSAYEREQRIQAEDPGATTQKAVDQARAAYESQIQNVSYNRSQLDLAERNLVNTELRGPFDGTVAARYVEPSEVATRGQHILEVYAEGAMRIAVSVPEQIIERVRSGVEGTVTLANRPDEPYVAVVSDVGSAASTANAFPVKALIVNDDERVRPGMTAELQLNFVAEGQPSGYLIPLQALLPGVDSEDRNVFLYDSATSTIRKTEVSTRGIQGNRVIVTKGVSPGDILVVAGVPFLADGQEVTLMKSSGSAN